MKWNEFANYIHLLRRGFESGEIVDSVAMETAGAAKEYFREGFKKGETPDGEKWQPLSQTTIENKIRNGVKTPERPLVETGELEESLRIQKLPYTRRGGKKYQLSYSRIDSKTGRNIAYFHNSTQRRHKHTPQRKFIGDSQRLRRRLRGVLYQTINRRLKAKIHLGISGYLNL